MLYYSLFANAAPEIIVNNDKIYRASTTVLINISTDSWPHKVFLIKRDLQAAFLPGAHVFPGGRVDETDEQLGAFLVKDELNLERIEQSFLSDRQCTIGHLWAALREAYEESGLCFLKKSSDFCTSEEISRIILGQKPQFTPCLNNIWPLSWWITPKGEARRFDTWFFLGLVENDLARPFSTETSDHQWFKPTKALAAHEQGHIFLAPPTRAILERLAQTTSLEEFLSFVDQPLRPIRPYFVSDPQQQGHPWLVLPGDPLHHEKERSRLPMFTRYRF